MHKNLKIALKRRSSEQGFAIPIVMGLGLVMLLIGTMMIVRSQGDQVTASAQKATNRGLSAAETGITRYQSLINNNRAIATYNDCNGARNSSGTCPDTGTTTISWANATKIPVIASSGITSCSNSGGASAVIDASKTTAWQDVSASNSSLGQYRLVSYVYPAPGTTGTAGVAPGTGQLTVEGRVNQVGSSTSASTTVGTATTQLQVNIPVQQGNPNNFTVPGLWLSSGGMPDNQTVKGNIILNDCSISPPPTPISYQAIDSSTNKPYIDPNTGKPYKTIQSFVNFPPLPTKPSSILNTISGGTLPKATDTATTKVINGQSVQLYEYSASNISSNITITPGAKVTIYLDGNIPKNTSITHDCSSTTGCKPTDFQIFGYSSTGTMCLNGNNHLDAFIFAPNYAVGVDGGGNSGGFFGSLWVNQFGGVQSCSSNSNKTVVFQSADWNTLGFTPNLPPVLAPIISWQRQEALP